MIWRSKTAASLVAVCINFGAVPQHLEYARKRLGTLAASIAPEFGNFPPALWVVVEE